MMRIRNLIFTPIAVLSVLAGVLMFAGIPTALAAGRTELGSFGREGPGTEQFAQPNSITVEQLTGDVYIYERGENSAEEKGNVYKLTAEGDPVGSFTTIEGVGGFRKGESQIAVDNSSGPDAGDIYVATGEAVLIFNSAGTELGTLTEAGEPEGVAVNPSGHVYVTSKESLEVRIDEYTPVTNPVKEANYTCSLYIGVDGGEAATANIAADSIGNIYASRGSEGTVDRYEASQCNTTKALATPTPVATGLGEHITLAVDPANGDVYIDEQSKIAVYDFSAIEGKYNKIEEFGAGSLAGSYGVAVSDAADYKGDVYASYEEAEEEEAGEVIRFGPASAGEEQPFEVKTKGSGSGTVECEINKTGGFTACPLDEKYTEGTEISVRTKADGGSALTSLSGSGSAEFCTSVLCEFTITEPSSVTATFEKEPSVSSVSPSSGSTAGGTEVTIKGTGFVDPATVTIGGAATEVEVKSATEIKAKTAAHAAGGVEVIVKDADGTSTGGPTYTYEAGGPATEFTLTVAKAGEGSVMSSPSGIVCGATCSHAYPEGEKVKLTETPQAGYVFVGWIGCKGAASICEVEMTREAEVIAVFLKEGEKGSPGAPGAPGESPVITPFAGNEHGCSKGGIEVKVGNGTPAYICNGPEGAKGANGTPGSNGAQGAAGSNGTNGEKGAQGPAGPQGLTGMTGPVGPQGLVGPAGKVEIVTCKTVRKKGKKSAQQCTTKLVSGTVTFTTAGTSAVQATLSRHGAVYATGTAHSATFGHMSLRLAPLRGLRPGRYTLTLIRGTGSHESIRSEPFTLR